MTKDRPSKQALVLREGTPGSLDVTIQVDAWLLDAPSVEYFADTCSARSIDGTPTLLFAQRGLDGNYVNAIEVAMPNARFREMVTSFEPVIAKMDPQEKAAGLGLAETQVQPVSPGNYRKFYSSMVRGGTTADGAMMDFYRVAVTAGEHVRRAIPPDLVQACVRVFMTPSTMVHLFDIIERRGLVK